MWNVSHIHGVYFKCPSGKQPWDNVKITWKVVGLTFSVLLDEANLMPVSSGPTLPVTSYSLPVATVCLPSRTPNDLAVFRTAENKWKVLRTDLWSEWIAGLQSCQVISNLCPHKHAPALCFLSWRAKSGACGFVWAQKHTRWGPALLLGFASVVNRRVSHVCHLIEATLSFTLKLDHQIHHSVRTHLQATLVVRWSLNTFPERLWQSAKALEEIKR